MIHIKKSLLANALQLSYKGKRPKYERLEFLGDRVIGLIIAEMLYQTFPNEDEGAMAKRFVALTREEALSDIARQIGLPDMMKTNEESLRQNNSVLSDVCEAVIAAIYLDKGYEKARQFVEILWTPLLNQPHQSIKDSKSALQELAHKHKTTPVYETLSKDGPDHAPIYTIKVTVPSFGETTATGNSKKEAMQTAAQQLLDILQKNKSSKTKDTK
jgi:ribonuclease-3